MKEKKKLFLGAASGFALALILITSMAVNAAHAQTFTVLYNFGGVPGDPLYPQGGPIAQGRDGNLYAMTFEGGITNDGTVFRITPTGTLTVLSSLGGNAGSWPYGGLTLALDGGFYGGTCVGGLGTQGTVFHITPEGNLAVLYPFSFDMLGGCPLAPPMVGADSNLYGTLEGEGRTFGGVYKISAPHQLTTLYQFAGYGNGKTPAGPLVQAIDGSFYGTANEYAFKISAAGAFTNLGLLPGHANTPLIQDSDGNFYGVTAFGTSYQKGTVFELTRSGKIELLHKFTAGIGGSSPSAALVQATDGNFYGVTRQGGASGYGVIYRLSPTGDFFVIYSFDFTTGAYPYTLLQHTNGILYGEAAAGTYSGGVFFSLDIGAPPFVRRVTSFGKVGRTIGILGQGFTGATEVSFNGIPATFTVSSDTYLEAIVPVGAVTGFVSVTTSTGTLTSNQQIQIRQ